MQNKKIKVLHVIPGFGGGISSFVKDIALGNNSSAVINDVVGFNYYPNYFANIIKHQNGNCFTLSNFHKKPFETLQDFRKILLKGGYDVLHCHLLGYKGFIFKLIAKHYHIELIITHAHTTNNDDNTIFKSIRKRINQIFSRALSDQYFACGKIAGKYVFGATTKKIKIIPNGIQFDKWVGKVDECEKSKLKQELLLSEDNINIINIGRFSLQKNHDFIIDICHVLKTRGVKFKCYLCGEGELHDSIKYKVNKLELQDNVIFLGFRNDVQNVLKLMNFVILPSFYEGLPTVIVESQAAGIPALLSNKITTEVDFGLGLVTFLSIDDAKVWADKICKEVLYNQIPSPDSRLKEFDKRGYTLESMQRIYIEGLLS